MRSIVTHTRHGIFAYPPGNCFAGKVLSAYGEYSEDEVNVLRKCLRPGDVAINVGANIGAFVAPMARLVGPTGHVYAFEAHPETAAYLRRNVVANELHNVTIIEQAAGAALGKLWLKSYEQIAKEGSEIGSVIVGEDGDTEVEVTTIDALKLDKLKFVMADVEGSELDVLKGAADTIARLRPMLYLECDKQGKVEALIGYLAETLHYRMYWHVCPYWSANNFRGVKAKNCNTISQNIFCAPEESGIEVTGWDEVSDVRKDERIFDREIERYSRISKFYPDDLAVRLMLAHHLNLAQRREEAEALLVQNLAVDPAHVPTLAIRALLDLQAGHWRDGFRGYELRYQNREAKTRQFGYRPHDCEKWDGRPTDEPVLIWAEQGFGDSIMFGRFIARAEQLAPNLVVEMQSQLYELFEISGIPASGAIRRRGRALPKYRYHCSIPSLPAVLGVATDDEIRCPPYLRCDPAMLRAWTDREQPRIGFCWQGSLLSERPYTRDIDPDLFVPVTSEFGAFLSLSYDGQFDSFTDTAACIMSLDLVITVDTSVAHLAGALGKECWLLLSLDSDWRWGLGEDQVWYPSMRVFKQKTVLGWGEVVERVHEALIERREARDVRAA